MSRFKPNKEVKPYIDGVVEDLKALGCYRPEMDGTIYELAFLRMLFDKNETAWASEGYQMTQTRTNKADHENIEKSQYLQNHLQLDDKILRREKELGLTTVSMKNVGYLEGAKSDDLADFMKALVDD